MDKNTTLTINKRFIEFEDISKNKTKVLSRLSITQLKNLIKRCEEVILQKISEGIND